MQFLNQNYLRKHFISHDNILLTSNIKLFLLNIKLVRKNILYFTNIILMHINNFLLIKYIPFSKQRKLDFNFSTYLKPHL